MRRVSRKIVAASVEEIAAFYRANGGIDPKKFLAWVEAHPESATHKRIDWDEDNAVREYRLSQIRQIITEIEVIYPDRQVRQVYVSPIQSRGTVGYVALVDVMSDPERRAAFLLQAFEEYRRAGLKYIELRELAGVRRALANAERKARKRSEQDEQPHL